LTAQGRRRLPEGVNGFQECAGGGGGGDEPRRPRGAPDRAPHHPPCDPARTTCRHRAHGAMRVAGRGSVDRRQPGRHGRGSVRGTDSAEAGGWEFAACG